MQTTSQSPNPLTQHGSQSPLKPFRFGAGGEGNREEKGVRKFIELAQEIESVGFDTFAIPDHLGEMVGPFAALGALSQATSKITLATSVLSNGLRHPAVIAKELLTIDVLSKGRLEVGLGAGINRDYDKAGIPFESPAIRYEKLTESFTILETLLRGAECTFEGKHYTVQGLQGYPRPRQGPRPKIAIGGGGPKMLRFAAQHADIVSVAVPTTADGRMVLSEMTLEKTKKRVDIIRDAAGERFSNLELNWTIAFVVVTDDRVRTAQTALEAMNRQLGDISKMVIVDKDLTVDDILQSPYLAIGSFEEIADHLRLVREETSMSYVGVFPTQAESLYPVVSELRGK